MRTLPAEFVGGMREGELLASCHTDFGEVAVVAREQDIAIVDCRCRVRQTFSNSAFRELRSHHHAGRLEVQTDRSGKLLVAASPDFVNLMDDSNTLQAWKYGPGQYPPPVSFAADDSLWIVQRREDSLMELQVFSIPQQRVVARSSLGLSAEDACVQLAALQVGCLVAVNYIQDPSVLCPSTVVDGGIHAWRPSADAPFRDVLGDTIKIAPGQQHVVACTEVMVRRLELWGHCPEEEVSLGDSCVEGYRPLAWCCLGDDVVALVDYLGDQIVFVEFSTTPAIIGAMCSPTGVIGIAPLGADVLAVQTPGEIGVWRVPGLRSPKRDNSSDVLSVRGGRQLFGVPLLEAICQAPWLGGRDALLEGYPLPRQQGSES